MITQIFFDIDGTLISKDDNIRPYVNELLQFLAYNDIHITFWSGGGTDYASMWSRRIDPEGRFRITIMGKAPYMLSEGHFVVDDMEDVIKVAKGLNADGYKVSFFEPLIVKNDDELLKLKEYLSKKT